MFYLELGGQTRRRYIAEDIAMRKHGVAHAQIKCPSARPSMFLFSLREKIISCNLIASLSIPQSNYSGVHRLLRVLQVRQLRRSLLIF